MTRIQDILSHLHSFAPAAYAESYDNVGLLVGDPGAAAYGLLTTLDVTEEVIEEAIAAQCNVIVAHHPIIFSGLKSLTGSTEVERIVQLAIKNEVALIAVHTNLDAVSAGVNAELLKKLGHRTGKILCPKPDIEHLKQQVGSGMYTDLESPMGIVEYLNHVKKTLQVPCIKHTRVLQDSVKRVAVCGGSGSFLIEEAISVGADVYITADIKYHEFFRAEGKVTLIDIGHFETETHTRELLGNILKEKFTNIAVCLSKVNTNPVKYFL